MNAYTLVDNQIRKKLDEMLKTWKEPVPGSLDTRPVFPVEVTRTIENALIKARTAAVQLQQQQAKSQQEILARGRPTATPPVPWRNTPTPPQTVSRRPGMSMVQSNGQQYGTNGLGHSYSNQQVHPDPSTHVYLQQLTASCKPTRPAYPVQYSAQPAAPPVQAPYLQTPLYNQASQSYGYLDSLNKDIASLISSARTEFATNPFDQGIQQRLKALLDLQSILQTQSLPPDQLQMIRDQVAQLSSTAQSSVSHAAPLPPQPTLQQQEPNLSSLFAPNALAELLASTANRQQPTPPPPQHALPVRPVQTPLPPAPPSATPTATTGESSLLASLRAAGMLPPLSSTPTLPPALPASLPFAFTPHATVLTPPVLPTVAPRPAMAHIGHDVELTSASLKK